MAGSDAAPGGGVPWPDESSWMDGGDEPRPAHGDERLAGDAGTDRQVPAGRPVYGATEAGTPPWAAAAAPFLFVQAVATGLVAMVLHALATLTSVTLTALLARAEASAWFDR